MSTAPTIAREDQADAALESMRRCIVTGDMRPKDDLIRFVVAPDHSIVPDLEQNLPGRGLWLTASRAAIESAVAKNLFARAAKAAVTADNGLVDQVAQLLRQRCLSLLGLARSAGIAVLGQPQVEAALKKGMLNLLFLADDASGSVNNAQVETITLFNRHELGAAFGYGQSVYAGLKKHALTEKLRIELARLVKIAADGHLSKGMEISAA